ncbi:MAG: erythrose-4-phosphate dehydrogenase [Gammaproteobacteria bacterium]|nr:erythrose-4-phosphate dehydrogenase [Gammaproteobacteria bacterium]MBT8151448.1 erythrose-4-phosphate dehydrogenase [Gammaproteobacteria bacterium]NND39480.1 erythrose-4-phosphate dehydrogenase [Pseudomonadales bacterium]NNM11588.1 erythrose-4-phosphate dehydrogenase [Pseudomonadales bacterium]RZV50893.1 MAG: erythrose-4-phosphate dehydrogenase [Pseudomonadales bacterium]
MRIAINGFGRVGRCVLRAAVQRADCHALQFVALNELASPDSILYLTQYDSTHGRFPGSVVLDTQQLVVQSGDCEHRLQISATQRADQLEWKRQRIELVMECTGSITTQEAAQQHLNAGAQRVLLSNPGESTIPAYVCGVNDSSLHAEQPIVSAASCTSNALVPVLHVLQEHFGIANGVITTVHASMHDQPVIDAYHSSDLRRNRAASQSIIPVDTALAAGIGRILPALDGKFVAHALRVPVNNVSALNVTVNLQQQVSESQVNEVLRSAAATALAGILGVSDQPLASCDFNGDSHSGIIDELQTRVSAGNTVNLLVWFDNEWAFANRMLDLALRMVSPSAQ